jgi:caffeoyl-CoA O-methyltransferase
MAEGLSATGKLITIDINAELETRARNYFQLAGLTEKVDYRVGDAKK